VITLSLNEVESLAAKVGRGGGLTWGLAEELSRGARRLVEAGLPWAEALAGLAGVYPSWRAPDPAIVQAWRERRDAPTNEAALCPLRLATLLMDDASILAKGSLRVGNVGLPLWLAGILAPVEAERGFRLDWPSASIESSVSGIALVAGEGDWLARRAVATITPLMVKRASAPRRRRAAIDASTLRKLSAIAERIYVPASEASRVRGAGGGRVDGD
jgi:hypothetical protein